MVGCGPSTALFLHLEGICSYSHGWMWTLNCIVLAFGGHCSYLGSGGLCVTCKALSSSRHTNEQFFKDGHNTVIKDYIAILKAIVEMKFMASNT